MFERFTATARSVVTMAKQEAQELNHPCIGTEHLLLAMLDESSGGTAVLLRDAGITRERVLADINRLVRPAPEALDDSDAEALQAIGIDLDAVRAKVEELFGPGALRPPGAARPAPRRGFLRRKEVFPGGHLPFAARTKKVIELSLREAIALHHNFIGSEHILLGLLRENGGLAAKILADAGVDFAALRAQAVAALRRAA
jgi:ATP-dependent Clp protease ATP-binding subunit ClpA